MRNRWLTALIVVLAVACGGKRTRTIGGSGGGSGPNDAGSGAVASDAGAIVRRALHVRLELLVTPDEIPAKTRVDLIMTDETGRTERVGLGEFTGTCTDVTEQNKSGPMTPIVSYDCLHDGRGTLLRLVARLGHIIVLRARVDAGEEPLFDEHKRVPVPTGVPIVTD